jgi:hypothetical protein
MKYRTTSTARRVATFGAGIIVGLTFLTGTASAKPATTQKAASTITEDNDTNDGTPNNLVDDGDNAHPSGKDRSVEHGGSGNQGAAKADPDDDGHGPDRSNGGIDQPGGAGGVDLADQDGNNGCGNDDDFEDDDEGWCGKHQHSVPETPAPAEDVAVPVPSPVVLAAATPTPEIPATIAGLELAVVTGDATTPRPTEVLGLELERSPEPVATSVLGVSLERSPLAFTGSGLTTLLLALAGSALVTLGLGLRKLATR